MQKFNFLRAYRLKEPEAKFKIIAIITLLLGVGVWGFVAFRAYQSRFLPVAGSSDMIMRNQAINEAIKKGEKTYSFETNGGPAISNLNNPSTSLPQQSSAQVGTSNNTED